MRKIITILLLLTCYMAQSQKLQNITGYGIQARRIVADTLLGMPNDTFPVPTALNSIVFISKKGSTVYTWNTSLLRWDALSSGSGTVTAAAQGLTLNSTTVELGSATQNASVLTSDRYINMRANSFFGTSRTSYFELSADSSLAGGAAFMRLSGPYGGAINLRSDTSARTFNSIGWYKQGTFKGELGHDAGPSTNHLYFDAPDNSDGFLSYNFEWGGLSHLLLYRTGFQYYAQRGIKRAHFGAATEPGQTLTVTGSLSVSDTAHFAKKMYVTDSTGYDIMLSARATPYQTKMITAADLRTLIGSSTPISGLTAATATNSINNSNYAQTWNWNTLQGGTGLKIVGNSSLSPTSADLKLFNVELSAPELTTGHTAYGIYTTASNNAEIFASGTVSSVGGYFSATGTNGGGAATKNNIALQATASGGDNNMAVQVLAGTINMQPLTATTILGLDGSKNIKSVALSGLSYDGTTLSVTGGSAAWNGITDPTGDQALTFDAGESSTWTNSNTTEDLFTVNSSTVTTSSFFSLNRTSTALGSGNNIMELVSSGVNASGSVTSTVLRISNTNSGTSSVNNGIDVTASGATTNRAIAATGDIYQVGNNYNLEPASGSAVITMKSSAGAFNTTFTYDASRNFISDYRDGEVLRVNGNNVASFTSTGFTVNQGGGTAADFNVRSTSFNPFIFVDVSADRMGIGVTTAAQLTNTLTVNGTIRNSTIPTGVQTDSILVADNGVIEMVAPEDMPFIKLTGTSSTSNPTIDIGTSGTFDITNTGGSGVITFQADATPTNGKITIDGNNKTLYFLQDNTGSASNGDALTLVNNTTGELGYAPNLTNILKKEKTEILAKNGTIYSRDAKDNITAISPHFFPQSQTPSEQMAWSYYSRNEKIGKEIFIDMLKLARVLEKLSGEQLVFINDIKP